MFLSGDIFSKSLAVLAFVIAFYALAARERKTPYITNSVYPTIYIILASTLLSLVSGVIKNRDPEWSNRFDIAAAAVFVLGVLSAGYWVRRIQNRHTNLRDDNLILNLIPVRKLRSLWRSIRSRPTYEHHPISPPRELTDELASAKSITWPSGTNVGFPSSIVTSARSLTDADGLLVELSKIFLRAGCSVQYTTCLRHPFELVSKLIESFPAKDHDADWRGSAKRVVVVDGYTPHFGFTDSIYAEKTKQIRAVGVAFITSKTTYAGLHSAAARAFNRIKKVSGDQLRRPTLTIYEGAYALADVESLEQYRIFIRHVLPSERLWGGMLTLFVEAGLGEELKDLLTIYADVFIELESGLKRITDG